MKKLILPFLTLALLASCGGSGGNSVGGQYSYSDPLTNGNISSGSDLNSYIALTQAKQVLENHQTSFSVGVLARASYEQDCSKKWGINFCKTIQSGSTTMKISDIVSQTSNLAYVYSDNTYVIHSNVDVQSKLNELSHYFTHATKISVYQGGANSYYSTSSSIPAYKIFYVQVGQSEYYEIDTRYPLQANPVRVQNGTVNRSFYNLRSF